MSICIAHGAENSPMMFVCATSCILLRMIGIQVIRAAPNVFEPLKSQMCRLDQPGVAAALER